MTALLRFALLVWLKTASRLLYRYDVEWVGEVPDDRWENIRLIAILNHTSLYEPVFAALLPTRMLWRLAAEGVVPIAEKTLDRPGVGWLLRFVGSRVVAISRKRDATWQEVLRQFEDPDAITVICPEGRMLRPTGLDSEGQPMTIRGGIADLLAGIRGGRLLLAYSGGLHHVAAPGDSLPRLFKRIAIRLEVVSIPKYQESLGGTDDAQRFREAVVQDLTRRRNTYCPLTGPTLPSWVA